MSFFVLERWNGVASNTTTLIQAAPSAGSALGLTNITAKCNTAATLRIFDGTTTNAPLFEIPLLADEGYAYVWAADNPLLASAASSIIGQFSATGTTVNINMRGFTYRVGR